MADSVSNSEYGLVSVIMPAYNAGKYIAEAIDSVIKQTYKRWELIVVDDGSTDNTAAIVKEHAGKESRVKYLYQQRKGQGSARNTGLLYAKSEFIAFLDADDLWLPEKLTQQIEVMKTNNVDLVFSDAYLFEDKQNFTREINITPGYYHGEEAVRKFIFCNYIPLLTVLLKKSAIENVNGFAELNDLHEDYHLWTRLLIAGHSFLGVDIPLAQYRIHPESSSSGEGKMLTLTINTLKDIKAGWPYYAEDINRSLYSLVSDHLGGVNINNWDLAGSLLVLRNSLSKENISIPMWKWIYSYLGKNIFRMLFHLKMKGKPAGVHSKTPKLSMV